MTDSIAAPDVVRAFEVMLGRPPESDSAIASHVSTARNQRELVSNIAASTEFTNRVGNASKLDSSPFHHFNASFDARATILSHAVASRSAREGFLVNFLGVAIPVRVMDSLHDRSGTLENIPIPANFHADIAEWAAALRAVDLAGDTFSVIELGCGWGCWMSNTGVAARSRGKVIDLVGIEGDPLHLDFARETFAANGITEQQYELLRGVAAATGGHALFPLRRENVEHWGFEPRFGVSQSESDDAVASGAWESLPMMPLSRAIGERPRVDLLHMDIQGGEADLVRGTLALLTERLAYVVIGTHSRSLEGQLMDLFLNAGWQLEIERPAIFHLSGGRPQTTVDGVQGWRNPRLLPA